MGPIQEFLLRRRIAKMEDRLNQVIAEELEKLETNVSTPVQPITVDDIRAAIESTKLPRRTLIVHPDIGDLAVIKEEAAKLNLDVVLGSRGVMKPGEAYVVMTDTSFIKKEAWEGRL